MSGKPSAERRSISKTSKELSQLTPMQMLQKKFGNLNAHVLKLKQHGPPIGSEKFFNGCQTFGSELGSFSIHGAKILKQRVLSAPLNLRSFEICCEFRKNFPMFIKSISHYESKISKLYEKSLMACVGTMRVNFDAFSAACFKDPHARVIILQYEDSCRSSLKQIEDTIHSIFQDAYESLTVDEASSISERIKTLGRFFVSDLQRELAPTMIYTEDLGAYYHAFRNAFLQLVPTLSSIPRYRDEFANVKECIDPLVSAFERVSRLIGDTPDAIKLKVKPSLTGVQPDLPVPEIDPFEEPLKQFSEFLSCDITAVETNVAKFEQLRSVAQARIESLQSELERVTKRLNVLEPMNTKEAIVDRFQQIRSFKGELSKQDQLERDKFMRDVLFQLRTLTSDGEINVKDDYRRQLRDMIARIGDNISRNQSEAAKARRDLEDAKALLQKHAAGESLAEMAKNMAKAKESSESALKMMKEKLNLENIGSLEEGVNTVCDIIRSQNETIAVLKQDAAKSERAKSMFRNETSDVLANVYTKLDAFLGNEGSVPPEKLTQLRDGVKEKLERLNHDRTSLSAFVEKLNLVLKLQGSSDVEASMSDIIDALTMPKSADLFLNTAPELARVKATPDERFKQFLCDIVIRLMPGAVKDDLENREIESLQELCFENLEKQMRVMQTLKEESPEKETQGDLHAEIAHLKKCIDEKEKEIQFVTSKVKDCQAHFFDYVNGVRTENEKRSVALEMTHSKELQVIVDFFEQLVPSDEF